MTTVAGSWEDLFEKAVDAAETNADDVDALFGRLITRLNKLPEKVLIAGDAYLVGLRDRAVAEYTRYLLDNGKADAALNLVVNTEHKLAELQVRGWSKLQALTYIHLDRLDEAEAVWVELAGGSVEEIVAAGNPDEVQESILALIDLKRFAAAARLLQALEKLIGDGNSESDRREQNAVLSLRVLLLMSINRPDEAIRAYARLLKQEPETTSLAPEYAGVGWRAGFTPDDIIRILDLRPVLKADLVEATWWRGYALLESGHTEAAQSLFRAIAQDTVLHDLEKTPEELWIYITAQYMLGDPKTMGLAAALDTLREASGNAPWTIYACAAIGWAMQDDARAMNLNALLATRAYKEIQPPNRELPPPWGAIAKHVLTPEMYAAMAGYFAERIPLETEDLPL